MTTAAAPIDQPRGPFANQWIQLIAGVICMAAVANYQYGWNFFVPAMQEANGWSLASIQWAFTSFLTLEVWLVPIEGPLVDKYGPKLMIFLGGIFAALGWIINAHAPTVQMLWFGNAVAGVGAGLVYGTCISNATKWFGARRGLAAGLTSMGFGAGAALTVVPILHMIKVSGYGPTFQLFGIVQGVIVILASFFFVMPPKTLAAAPKQTGLLQGTHDYTLRETLASPVFWVMFVMFVLVAAGGLTAVGSLATIAKDFYVDQSPVTIFIWTQLALAWTAQLNNIVNGATRPILGALSDRIGRENTMFFAFLVEGIGIWALWNYGRTPIAFVLLSGVVFFAWGEIYSIFPATCRDHFGQRNQTTNYGFLYQAKWVASFAVPGSALLVATTHSWQVVLYITAAMNIVAAIMALVVLKPLRIWDVRRQQAAATGAAGS
jgi:OFA family oxalate/formate antiporter-like MFS transporter